MKTRNIILTAVIGVAATTLIFVTLGFSSKSGKDLDLQSISRLRELFPDPPDDGHIHPGNAIKITDSKHNTLYILPFVNTKDIDVKSLPEHTHVHYKTQEIPVFSSNGEEIGSMVVAYDVEVVDKVAPLENHTH